MSFFIFLFLIIINSWTLEAQNAVVATDSTVITEPRKYFAVVPEKESKITSETLMKEAITHFDGQRYQRSIDLLNEAIDSNTHEPLVPILYYYRAVSKMKVRQVKTAIEDYTVAIKASPYKAKYHYHRGLAYFELQDFVAARRDFERTLAINGGDADLYVKLGFLKQQENDLHGALADYNKATELAPNFAQPYYYRGLIYLQVLLPEKACMELQKAAHLGHVQAARKEKEYCQ